MEEDSPFRLGHRRLLISALCVRTSDEPNHRAGFKPHGLMATPTRTGGRFPPDSDVQGRSVAVGVLWPSAWRGKYPKLRIIYAFAKGTIPSLSWSASSTLLKPSENGLQGSRARH